MFINIINNKMTIPFKRVLTTTIFFCMRPINNIITSKCKTASKDSYRYRFFAGFGQYANIYEVKLKRAITGRKGLGEIKPLSDDIAFKTGAEWFTEVFVFYGTLFAIAYCWLIK